jgi:hypothetical protein
MWRDRRSRGGAVAFDSTSSKSQHTRYRPLHKSPRAPRFPPLLKGGRGDFSSMLRNYSLGEALHGDVDIALA